MKIANRLLFTVGVGMLLVFLGRVTNAQVFEKGTKLVDAGLKFNGFGIFSVVPVFSDF